jgi:hypothetical protein
MITLTENMRHQVTMLGTGLIAESQTGMVDATGFKLLAVPVVTMAPDGSITLQIAEAVNIEEAKPKRASRVKEDPPEDPSGEPAE